MWPPETQLQSELEHLDAPTRESSPLDEEGREKKEAPDQNQLLPGSIRSSKAPEQTDLQGDVQSKDRDFGKPCHILKPPGWTEGWRGLAVILGSQVYPSGPSLFTEDTEPAESDQKATQNRGWSKNLDELIGEAWTGEKQHRVEDNSEETSSLAQSDSAARVTGWQPRCPHYDRPNKYGHMMCDPVLPRICEDIVRNEDYHQSVAAENEARSDRPKELDEEFDPLLFLSLFF